MPRKGESESSRERRANFYLPLTEIRKANFNKLFELVAGISRDCNLKEEWQLLYWNMHNGKVLQSRGEIGNVYEQYRLHQKQPVIRV